MDHQESIGRQRNAEAKYVIYGQDNPSQTSAPREGKAIQSRGVTAAPFATYDTDFSSAKQQPGDKVGNYGKNTEFDPSVYAESRRETAITNETRRMKNYVGNGVLPTAESVATDQAAREQTSSARPAARVSITSDFFGTTETSYPDTYRRRSKTEDSFAKVGDAKSFDPEVYRDSRRENTQVTHDSKARNNLGAGGGNIFRS